MAEPNLSVASHLNDLEAEGPHLSPEETTPSVPRLEDATESAIIPGAREATSQTSMRDSIPTAEFEAEQDEIQLSDERISISSYGIQSKLPSSLQTDSTSEDAQEEIYAPDPPPAHDDIQKRIPSKRKRLFVCCDGTWNNAIGSANPITNVARLARCVPTWTDDEGREEPSMLQLVYYSSGVGTMGERASNVVQGSTGKGTPCALLPTFRLSE